jgi:hypothetical protein
LRGELHRAIVNSWLTGLLSQADPSPGKYPKLEALTEERQAPREAPPPDEPAESRNNARLWGMALKSMNKRAGVWEE